jgi:endonuclease YncB( thermonuclease family)
VGSAPVPSSVAALADATLLGLKVQAKQDPAVRFGLHATRQPCKVVKVYDGDSVTLAWVREPPGGPLCYANCRLFGIDTPELRGTSGQERARAEACRDAMRDLALDQLFVFSTVGDTGLDKYGRPLVVLHAQPGLSAEPLCRTLAGDSLNDWALRALPGCKPYFGGKKEAGEGP